MYKKPPFPQAESKVRHATMLALLDARINWLEAYDAAMAAGLQTGFESEEEEEGYVHMADPAWAKSEHWAWSADKQTALYEQEAETNDVFPDGLRQPVRQLQEQLRQFKKPFQQGTELTELERYAFRAPYSAFIRDPQTKINKQYIQRSIDLGFAGLPDAVPRMHIPREELATEQQAWEEGPLFQRQILRDYLRADLHLHHAGAANELADGWAEPLSEKKAGLFYRQQEAYTKVATDILDRVPEIMELSDTIARDHDADYFILSQPPDEVGNTLGDWGENIRMHTQQLLWILKTKPLPLTEMEATRQQKMLFHEYEIIQEMFALSHEAHASLLMQGAGDEFKQRINVQDQLLQEASDALEGAFHGRSKS